MLYLLIKLIAVGVVFYLAEMLPIAAPFQTVIRVVAILVAIVFVLQFFGLASGLNLQ